MIRLANAPVSYGVFGDLDVDGVVTTAELLDTMARSGYAGSELGPPGFFGDPDGVARVFADAGLTPVGAYVPLHTQDPDALERDLARMDQTFAELERTNPDGLAILADEGSDDLLRRPRKDPAQSLAGDDWARLVRVLSDAATRARDRGLRPSVHPHIATFVELPDEVERLLDATDLSLTFDIGHLVLAGGDGIALYRRWRERINHVHIKDVHIDVLETARAERRTDFDEWWSGVSTTLGRGDSRLDEFAEALLDTGYDGWVVVEQDRAPLTAADYPAVVADQAANLRWLEDHLGPALARKDR